jgi:thiamine kinase-like enzyme
MDAPVLADVFVRPRSEDFDASVRTVCGMLVPADELATAQVSTQKLTLGITNQLFVVSVTAAVSSGAEGSGNEAEPRLLLRFLLRVFGAEGIIDRSVENDLFMVLAAAHIGPGYLGRFANGRCEQWLEGWKNLEVPDLPDPSICACVALKLAEVHAFRVPPPASRHFDPTRSGLWQQLMLFVDVLEKTPVADEAVAARMKAFSTRFFPDGDGGFSGLKRDAEQLQASAPAGARVCFCHNDMLAFNIMRRQPVVEHEAAAAAAAAAADGKQEGAAVAPVDPADILLIDFEYGCYNYRGFDIANYFCEWAGGNQDGKPVYANFPSDAQQHAFCTTYLQALAKLGGGGGGGGDGGGDVPAAAAAAVAAVDGDELAQLIAEVTFFVPVVHLYWTAWALNQARDEGCEGFDYILFGTNRYQESLKRRVVPSAPLEQVQAEKEAGAE